MGEFSGFSGLPSLLSFTLLLFALFLFKKKQKEANSSVRFSSFSPLPFKQRSFKAKCASFALWLPHVAFLLLLIAAANPHSRALVFYPSNQKEKSQFLFLLMDQSGSMNSEVVVKGRWEKAERMRKMDLAKRVSTEFIAGGGKEGFSGRQGDLLGLIRFARTAHMVLPPTFDYRQLAAEVERLDVLRDEEGIGTAIGYAVYKALHMIEMTKEAIKNGKNHTFYPLVDTAVIVVTDGFEEIAEGSRDLHAINVEEAAFLAKEMGVKLYIVNVDPVFSTSRYEEERRAYDLLTELTGGKFFMVSSSQGLSQVFKQIEALEPSLQSEKQKVHVDRYLGFPLIAAALLLLFFYTVFFSFVGRRA